MGPASGRPIDRTKRALIRSLDRKGWKALGIAEYLSCSRSAVLYIIENRMEDRLDEDGAYVAGRVGHITDVDKFDEKQVKRSTKEKQSEESEELFERELDFQDSEEDEEDAPAQFGRDSTYEPPVRQSARLRGEKAPYVHTSLSPEVILRSPRKCYSATANKRQRSSSLSDGKPLEDRRQAQIPSSSTLSTASQPPQKRLRLLSPTRLNAAQLPNELHPPVQKDTTLFTQGISTGHSSRSQRTGYQYGVDVGPRSLAPTPRRKEKLSVEKVCTSGDASVIFSKSSAMRPSDSSSTATTGRVQNPEPPIRSPTVQVKVTLYAFLDSIRPTPLTHHTAQLVELGITTHEHVKTLSLMRDTTLDDLQRELQSLGISIMDCVLLRDALRTIRKELEVAQPLSLVTRTALPANAISFLGSVKPPLIQHAQAFSDLGIRVEHLASIGSVGQDSYRLLSREMRAKGLTFMECLMIRDACRNYAVVS